MREFLILLSFLFSILYLLMGIQVLRLGARKSTHRLFFVSSLFLAWYAFCYTMIFQSNDISEVWRWWRLGAPAWIVMPAILVHFISVLIHKDMPEMVQRFIYLIYVIPLVMTVQVILDNHIMVDKFIKTPFGWTEVIAGNNPWVWVFMIFSMLLTCFALLFIIFRNRKSQTIKTRKQTWLIVVSALTSSLSTVVINILLPIFKINDLPPLGHLTMGIWFVGIWIAIARYKLMIISPEIVVDEILEKMNDILILLNPEGKIIKTNHRVVELLGFSDNDLYDRLPFPLIVNESTYNSFKKIADRGDNRNPQKISLSTNFGKNVLVEAFISRVLDRDGDDVGYIFIAHDMREMEGLKEQSKIREQITSELRITNAELEDERNKLRQRNERMENDLNMARRIQSRFIPTKSPTENISFLYKPMEKVGGDFFDFVQFSNGNIGIFISDVSGHGVPAAFVTSMLKSFCLQFGDVISNPAEFLFHLNEMLYNQTAGNFVTAFYGIFNPVKRTLTYSSAAHHLPILIDKDEVRAIQKTDGGSPLGIFTNTEIISMRKAFCTSTVSLEKNSKLIFYTDGLSEAENISALLSDDTPAQPDFGTTLLFATLHSLKDSTPQETIYTIWEELVKFRGTNIFDDDVCIICLKV